MEMEMETKMEMKTKMEIKKEKKAVQGPYFVYLLVSTSGATYVGATTNLDQRLRKHNKEIKGGAHATSIKILQGEIWRRVCHVKNFPDWSSALQFEWRFKQLSRKYSKSMIPLKRRILALNELLALDTSTSKAMPFSLWENPPELVVESDHSFFLSGIVPRELS